MKVWMTTDLEGVSGVTQVNQSFPDRHRYEPARLSLTRDVNAAVLGARDAGATDIIVLDGHGGNSGYNFVYEELVDGAKYQLGSPRTRYCEGLTPDTHCVFAVGYHAMAGTRAAVLDHTQSSMSIINIRLNGQLVGELGMEAYVAGHYGVPVALVTGDDKVCLEARGLIGDEVVTACVKWSAKRQSALCLAPGEARALIREKAAQAVKAAKGIKPLKLDGPAELRVEYLRTEMCEHFWGRRDVEMPDPRTVVFRGANALEVMNAYCGY